jgi:hypothetical protein
MIFVLVCFFSYVFLSNKVLVPHSYRGTPEEQFVPLFLPKEASSQIDSLGSRTAWLQEMGVDVVVKYNSETSIAATFIVLLTVYTLLIASLASVFAVLGVHLLLQNGNGSTLLPGDSGEEIHVES